MTAPACNTWICLAIVSLGACSGVEEPTPAAGCAWFQQCGEAPNGQTCGACDDDNPCTEDRCVGNAECTHLVVTDECSCTPACDTSHLRIVQDLRQGDGGLPGLDAPSAMAVTDDGKYLYVGARRSESVTLFVGGESGFEPAARVPAGPVTGLVLADQGRWLVATADDALRVFELDPATGKPTLSAETPGPFSGIAVDGARVVAVTGDKLLVVDLASGGSALVTRPELAGARSLVFDASGTRLHVAGFDLSHLVILDATVADWPVVDLESGAPGLDHPDAVALVNGETQVIVAGYCDSALGLFDRRADGSVDYAGALSPDPPVTECATVYGTPGLNHPGALVESAPGILAVASGKPDPFSLDYFRVEGGTFSFLTGVLAGPPVFDCGRHEFVTESVPSTGPPSPNAFRGTVAAVRSSNALFVSTSVSNAVGVFSGSEPKSVADEFLQRGAGGTDGLACSVRLELSYDKDELYVAQRCMPGLGVVAIDPKRGTLSPSPPFSIEGARAGGENAAAVAVAGPDWVGVTVTSDTAPRLALLRRDPSTRALAQGPILPLPKCAGQKAFPVGIAASPDGKDLYLADFQPGSKSCIHWAHRSGSDDWQLTTAVESVDVGGAESLVFTADGKYLYVASHVAEAVAVLSRSPDTGEITITSVTTHPDLRGAEFVALSPDETSLYVTSPVTDAVVAFARDLETGALTYRQSVSASDKALLLGDPAGLAVSPDGQFVYVTARLTNALVVLSRSSDGTVTPAESIVGAFEWPNGIAVAPDGEHVYVASVRTSSVTVLRNTVNRGQDGCFGACL